MFLGPFNEVGIVTSMAIVALEASFRSRFGKIKINEHCG